MLCDGTIDDLPAAPGVPLVSGQCHGFPVHKEDVSTELQLTTCCLEVFFMASCDAA